MRRRSFIAALVFLSAAGAALAQGIRPDLAVGQEWSLKNSPGKIIIGRIEPWYGLTAVHISVIDLKLPPGSSLPPQVGHMAFDKDSIVASVDKLIASDAKPLPPFEQEYSAWKASNSGLFMLPVPEAIDMLNNVRSGL